MLATQQNNNIFKKIWHRLHRRFSGFKGQGRLAGILAIVAFISGVATYITLTKDAHNIDTIYWLLNLDLIVFLMLGAVVARQAVFLWTRRKRGVAGSRLHVRLVFIFSLLTVTPAILMAVFSSVFFYFGVQAWFNDRVSTAVNDSLVVAQAYLKEHQQVMRADVLAMANDLNREAPYLMGNQVNLNRFVQTQSRLRNLSEAMVFSSSGDVLAKSRLTFTLEFNPLPETVLEQARGGEVVLLSADNDDRIRALVKLDRFVDSFLLVGRFVDSTVLSHMATAEGAVKEYTELEGKSSHLQIMFTLMFIAVALLLLLVAIWLGLYFARQLANPISALIVAAERVRAGDLDVRVDERTVKDELSTLERAFNRMTSQLQTQREELMSANRLLDERRRFTEIILAGTSSGIIGLDKSGFITLANDEASNLIGFTSGELIDRNVVDIIPEVKELFQQREDNLDKKNYQKQIDFFPSNNKKSKTLLIRLTTAKGDVESAILTIDDISELVTAQRMAAWADVAQRIAHEIKNPLTPIQLSAERLKKKYLKNIKEDPEIFEQCTDTIVRQVQDIGRMVGAFSDFARLPDPQKKLEDITSIYEGSLVLQQQAYRDIAFELNSDIPKGVKVSCDRAQINQVLTNILQNAVDVIKESNKGSLGKIIVSSYQQGKEVFIEVQDNGKGLPEGQDVDRLTEPYVTTRKKGTGLGLAIVKKIIEDHGGKVTLKNVTVDGNVMGARVTIILPIAGEV